MPIDTEDLALLLERAGADVPENPRYAENFLFPFERQLEKDPDYTGRTAGVWFFRGVPVTEEEYENLQSKRSTAFREAAEDVARRRVITGARDLRRSEVGTEDQLRSHLERVIREQEDYRLFADLARDAFNHPEKYDEVERPGSKEAWEMVQRELGRRLDDIRAKAMK